MFSIIAIGFFLGIAHATDPDHVIAVTTITNRERNLRRAALIGVAWGVGHTLTVFLVGSVVLLVGTVVPGRVELSMELAVSLMLVVLGAVTLRDMYRRGGWVTFNPPHSRGSVSGIDPSTTVSRAPASQRRRNRAWGASPRKDAPAPPKSPGGPKQLVENLGRRPFGARLGGVSTQLGLTPEAIRRRPSWASIQRFETGTTRPHERNSGSVLAHRLYHLFRPLVVGVVHGLAGSAAVALLILATIPNSNWAIVYLLVFGLGTISGMTLFTLGLTTTSRFLHVRYPGFSQWMSLCSGLASVGFGVLLAWRLLA